MAYALAFAPGPIGVTAGPLLGRSLAPSPGLATLPLAVQLLAMMAAGIPSGMIMQRWGRRRGFQLGMAVGVAGSIAGALAGRGFIFLLVASACLGFMLGMSQLLRFAAAEMAPHAAPKAVGTVLLGGIAASVIGPGIVFLTRDLLPTPFAGAYLSAGVLALFVALWLQTIPFAPVPPAPQVRARRRLPRGIAPGIAAAALGYGAMALVMTATPLAMTDAGHGLGVTATIIMAHGLAMFAPSFLTGDLVARFGAGRVIAAGWGALVAACLAIYMGTGVAAFTLALVLLGVGWNGMFVGGTSIVAARTPAGLGPRVQGINDLLVLGAGAAGSLLAGVLVDRIGWGHVPTLLLVLLLGLGGAVAWAARPAATPGATWFHPPDRRA